MKRLEKSYPHGGDSEAPAAAVFLPVVPATDPNTEYVNFMEHVDTLVQNRPTKVIPASKVLKHNRHADR